MELTTMTDYNEYIYTIEDVASKLEVCTQTIRNRMAARKDAATRCAQRVGRRWRFSEAVFTSQIALPG